MLAYPPEATGDSAEEISWDTNAMGQVREKREREYKVRTREIAEGRERQLGKNEKKERVGGREREIGGR